MNPIKHLDIRLDKDYFYPGDLIEGKLVVEVVQPLHLNGIHLWVRGKAHCEWKVYVSGDRRIIRDDQYFIDERTVIWDAAKEEQQEKKEETVASLVDEGVHEFHFSFQLPLKDIPCSLESRACSVRYHLRAILDIPNSPADSPLLQGVKYFTLIGPIVDCNDNKYLNPLFGSEKRWRYCWCCRQQTASLRCILDRNAFCSGETIRLKSVVQNYSTEAAKLKVRLVQFCEFNAQKANLCGVTKEVQHLVLEYTSDEMGADEEFELTTSHCLPILPPSIVGVSRLLQLYYTLTVCLEFERSGQDLQMLFPIRIGTRPYTGAGSSDFQLQYGPCCDHVEGGIYVDPEFTRNGGGGFWDDDEKEGNEMETGGKEAPLLYRPVYLNVVRCPVKEEEKEK